MPKKATTHNQKADPEFEEIRKLMVEYVEREIKETEGYARKELAAFVDYLDALELPNRMDALRIMLETVKSLKPEDDLEQLMGFFERDLALYEGASEESEAQRQRVREAFAKEVHDIKRIIELIRKHKKV